MSLIRAVSCYSCDWLEVNIDTLIYWYGLGESNLGFGTFSLIYSTDLATFEYSYIFFMIFLSSIPEYLKIFSNFSGHAWPNIWWIFLSYLNWYYLTFFNLKTLFKRSSLSSSGLLERAVARWLDFVLSSLNVSPVVLSWFGKSKNTATLIVFPSSIEISV